MNGYAEDGIGAILHRKFREMRPENSASKEPIIQTFKRSIGFAFKRYAAVTCCEKLGDPILAGGRKIYPAYP